MKRLIIALLLITLLVVPIACARAPEEAPAPLPAPAPAVPSGGEDIYKEAGGVQSITEERLIVRTGNMSLVVTNVAEARDEIARLASSFDGYVVSSQIWGEEQEMRGSISIRVPDESFESVLSELRGLAVRVESESTESRDVTEEYVDLEARLKNAEATESQYLTLLEKTEEVNDILKIYEKLSQVRRDIEQIKGRMQYLERTSSMSLISVYLEPVASSKPLIGAWNVTEALKSAVRGIVIFGQWLATALIWLAIFSPLWGTVTGVILWRRRRRKKAAS